MLFDLRGRGRRRTIQAIYLALAVLMGGGLVFFGIGGNTSGGLFDAFKSNGGGSSSSTSDKRLTAAEKRVRVNPRDAAGWVALAQLRAEDARLGDGFDQAKGTYTDKGRAKLAGAGTAWKRYLALDPKKPDADAAAIMVQVFGPAGLSQLEDAVRAEEIVVDSQKPNANLFGQLAVLAYAAGQVRKGDLAADKAVSLTPKDQRADLKQQLDDAKNQALGQSLSTQTTG